MLDNRETNSIWVYEGFLLDPFNGRRIAEVEGVELVRHLTDSYYLPGYVENNKDEHKDEAKVEEQIDINVLENNIQTERQPMRVVNNQRSSKELRNKWKIQKKRLGDLAVSSILFPPKATRVNNSSSIRKSTNMEKAVTSAPSWDYASTILSRKFFCYRDPVDKRKILSSIRVRPGVGKVRKLRIHEAVALYDTATTFISRDNGRELSVHTEWPNGRSILAKAEHAAGNKELNSDWMINDSPASTSEFESSLSGSSDYNNIEPFVQKTNDGSRTKTFEYTVYAKGQTVASSNLKSETNAPSLGLTRSQLIELNKLNQGVNFNEATISPPRSRFIQFGPDKISNDKYGARESYYYSYPLSQTSQSLGSSVPMMKNVPMFFKDTVSTVTLACKKCTKFLLSKMKNFDEETSSLVQNDRSPCIVRYTRYGECPPWYGAGRMCTLELVGKKVPSLQHVPPLVASLAAEKIPGFTSVNFPISSGLSRTNNNDDFGVDGDSTGIFNDKINGENEQAIENALKWFRDDQQNNHLVFDDDDENVLTRFRRKVQMSNVGKKSASFLNALKKATVGSAVHP